ncbi:MAG: 6-bladed beta-propeller [Gemmatimonas sp.]
MLFGSAILLLAVACTDSGNGGTNGGVFSSGAGRAAVLTKTLSIGPRTRGAEYQFDRILDLLAMPDGTVWVLSADLAIDGKNSRVRIFDSTGQFVRQVGAYGKGPGEYEKPYGMARLADGKVAVRDNGFPERILLYESDGTSHADMITDGRTQWPKLGNFRWIPGGSEAIRSDTFGVVWLPFDPSEIHTDSGYTYSSRYVRVRPGGQFIDVVDSAELPMIPESRVTWTKVQSTGGGSVLGFSIPYQPHGDFALSPGAQFAVGRTDKYQIDVMDMQLVQDPTEHAPPTTPRVIRVIKRSAPTVRVSQAEQDSILAQWKRDEKRLRLDSLVTFPAPAKIKPPIVHFDYSDDGQLLVWVAQPSTLIEGKWVESQVVDVFDQTGNFTGRLNLPPRFSLKRLKGNTMWGVSTDKGSEVPERITIRW